MTWRVVASRMFAQGEIERAEGWLAEVSAPLIDPLVEWVQETELTADDQGQLQEYPVGFKVTVSVLAESVSIAVPIV